MNTLFAAAIVATIATPSGTKVVDITTKPKPGFELITTAPWEVTITKERNVKVDTKEFKPLLPGFVLETQKVTQAGSFHYKATGYFCRKDKTECQRLIYAGTVQIKP